MPESKSIDDIFSDFKLSLQRNGYKLQEANAQSDLYKDGARFCYVLPDAIWMSEKKTEAKKSQEPTTHVFTKINPELTKHVTTFYDHARESAEKLGQVLTITAPTFAAGGVMVIYCGIKTK